MAPPKIALPTHCSDCEESAHNSCTDVWLISVWMSVSFPVVKIRYTPENFHVFEHPTQVTEQLRKITISSPVQQDNFCWHRGSFWEDDCTRESSYIRNFTKKCVEESDDEFWAESYNNKRAL